MTAIEPKLSRPFSGLGWLRVSELDKFFSRREPEPEPAAEPEAKRQSPRRYGSKGEYWFRDRFVSAGFTMEKHPDIPMVRGGSVDYTGEGRMVIESVTKTVHVDLEVKTFEGNWPWKQLTPEQAAMLDVARMRGHLALLGLVERKKLTIQRGWLLVWRRPANVYYAPLLDQLEKAVKDAKLKWGIQEIQHRYDLINGTSRFVEQLGIEDYCALCEKLSERATGGFKGKSWRPQDREALLQPYEIRKISGRWSWPTWFDQSLPIMETAKTPPF